MTEEQRAAALEDLKRITRNLPSRKELAKQEIRQGVDPRWVAIKYGLDVEKVLAAVDAWKAKADDAKAQATAV